MTELLSFFYIFAKIGLFTVGGGMAMIPLVQQELIRRGLMTVNQAMDMVSISQMTPGPFAVNCATFSGTRLHGLPGAVFATVGISLPSFILCLLVSRWFFEYNQSPVIRSILSGIKPIVLALIFSGLISLGGSTIFPGSAFQSIDIPVLIIALVSSFFMIRMKTSPILLIVISGIFGAVFLRG